MCTDKPARSRGFSLPELILLIVVMAIALTGILLVFNTAVVGSVNPAINKQAIAIAESLMDEILLMPFTKPPGSTFLGTCPNATQANRAQFDSVDDYNCFPSAGGPIVTGITTIDGTAIPALAAYSVAVTVVGTALSTVGVANSKRVRVTVTGPGVSVVLDGYRLNY
jgi:MSHA pilin protein MshD